MECSSEDVTSEVVYGLLLSNLESKATVIAGEMSCRTLISIHPKSKPKQARGLMPLGLTSSSHTSTVEETTKTLAGEPTVENDHVETSQLLSMRARVAKTDAKTNIAQGWI